MRDLRFVLKGFGGVLLSLLKLEVAVMVVVTVGREMAGIAIGVF